MMRYSCTKVHKSELKSTFAHFVHFSSLLRTYVHFHALSCTNFCAWSEIRYFCPAQTFIVEDGEQHLAMMTAGTSRACWEMRRE